MEQAKVEVARVEADVAVVRCAGWLETQAAADLKQLFEDLIQTKGVKKVILDLASVDYVNSAVYGTFLHYGNLVKENGGTFIFSGLKPHLHRVFNLVGLGKVFPRVDKIEDALSQAGVGPAKK